MSRAYHTRSAKTLFHNRHEIEDHLLAKTTANTGGKIGTELELFVTTPEGLPLTFDQVEMVLEHMAQTFLQTLPQAQMAQENGRIVALDIPNLGDVSLEPGGQIELSTKPCASLTDLAGMNAQLRAALDKAAAFFDLRVTGQGHLPAFLKAHDMPRSRFAAYGDYLHQAHGKKADDLIETMKSCCGLQVNVDPMGDKFHEIYRALLLVDVAHSLAQRTTRQSRLHQTYALLVPEQLTPVFESLTARDNESLITHVVDRLLTLKVPFMPDDSTGEGFKSTAAVFGHTPTVGELLEQGLLTGEILDNALSLQLTMPNLRRHGVVETRAPDSVDTPEALMTVARQYHRFAYDDAARQKLLADFAAIDPQKLKTAFLSRFQTDPATLDIGGGKTGADLVRAVGVEQAVPAVRCQTNKKPFRQPK